MPHRAALLSLLLLAATAPAPPRWEILPPTPPPVTGATISYLRVDGATLRYATVGQGPPVILLHGGLANADYWGTQVPALSARHLVVLLDSRGHGRSVDDGRSLGYEQMADDVVALLDSLGLARADLVGWSDGAIVALDLAIHHPDRVGRIVSFAANTNRAGLMAGAMGKPAFAAYVARVRREDAALSPAPGGFDAFLARMDRMWAHPPDWPDARLSEIRTPVLVLAADHDEVIRGDHAAHIAAVIPGARLVVLRAVSHFAFMQDPASFNAAMVRFLDAE